MNDIERIERVSKQINEILQRERATLSVSSINILPDGRVSPVLQIRLEPIKPEGT